MYFKGHLSRCSIHKVNNALSVVSHVDTVDTTEIKACNASMVQMLLMSIQLIQWCLQLLRNTAYKGVKTLSTPRGKSRLLMAFHLVHLALHHKAFQGGSFVLKYSRTCNTTRVITGKMHSQSPILKS